MGKVEDIMEKHTDFFKAFHKHGLECGHEISELLEKRHCDCVVVPLYRSALAIRVNDDETVSIFTAGDPHAWGMDINNENLKETEYVISGDRFGPQIYMVWGKYCIPMKMDEEYIKRKAVEEEKK